MPITLFNVSATISRFLKRTTTNDDKTALRNDLAAAPLASPAFTGTPTAPTATAGTNTTQVATTAFVAAAAAETVTGLVVGTLTHRSADGLGSVSIYTDYLFAGQEIYWPSYSGTIGMERVVGYVTPTTGQTVSIVSYLSNKNDSFIKLAPAADLAALTLVFPDSNAMRNGNDLVIFTTKAVTTLTLTPGSGTSFSGASLTSLAANTSYRFVYTAGDSKWNYIA